jgi:2-polyprenyl-6-methoxyphenol hydroxylase-like FAD-dependent oxidoreductase
MARALGRNSVVIGAGMGGLAAAAVLADHFEHVTVVERDAISHEALPRPGTPQSYHPHGLLKGGLDALCTLFPGFELDLCQAGAVRVRLNLDGLEEIPGHEPHFPRRDFGWTGYGMSRPLIEFVTRRRLSQIDNVTLRDNCRAVEILAGDDGEVAAVRCQSADGAIETIEADIVVDASARGALTLAFLKTTGRVQPEQTRVGIDMSYASTTFAVPQGHRDWKMILTFPDMPVSTGAGYVMPIEGERWMVIIGAWHETLRPLTGDAFVELARGLRTSTVYDAIKDARRLDKIHRFSLPESCWQHYDRLKAFPGGLLPIGDAVCRFNPIYGQGMAVAVQEASVLRGLLLHREAGTDRLAGLGRAYLAAIQPLIAAAWSQSVVPDFAFPQTRGERPADLENSLRISRAMMRVAARDPHVHRTLIAVRHLVESPTALHEPTLARRIEAEMTA